MNKRFAKERGRAGWFALAALLVFLVAPAPSYAIAITQTNSGAALLAALLSGSGLTNVGITVSGSCSAPNCQTGTFTNASGTYSSLLTGGIVLSSGNVSDYGDGPNTDGGFTTAYSIPASGAQEGLLDPITGGSFDHFDVVQVDISFDSPIATQVFFAVTFGSEEFPEFVGDDFIDGFGMYLNGTNIASVGGLPVNINHPGMAALGGTELDGILAPGGDPFLVFSGAVNPTGNTLTFILADTSDEILDSTAYISALGTQNPGVVPEPSTLLLLGAGLGALGRKYRRRA